MRGAYEEIIGPKLSLWIINLLITAYAVVWYVVMVKNKEKHRFSSAIIGYALKELYLFIREKMTDTRRGTTSKSN